MRPFRSRVLTAFVMTILSLGLLGTVAFANDRTTGAPVGPSPSWVGGTPPTSFPEDPWDPTTNFPEDPWPGV